MAFLNSDIGIKKNMFYELSSSENTPNLVNVKLVVVNKANRELAGLIGYLAPEICVDNDDVIEFAPTIDAIEGVLPGRKYIWIIDQSRKICESHRNISQIRSDSTLRISLLINK